ncbi:hypothetical protein D3C72_1699320 [compost metagenome]
MSTMNCVGPSSVCASTMQKAAPTAPVMNHLWPSMTQPSPSRRAVVRSIDGSEPAPGAGSVIAKHERMRPSAKGRR